MIQRKRFGIWVIGIIALVGLVSIIWIYTAGNQAGNQADNQADNQSYLSGRVMQREFMVSATPVILGLGVGISPDLDPLYFLSEVALKPGAQNQNNVLTLDLGVYCHKLGKYPIIPPWVTPVTPRPDESGEVVPVDQFGIGLRVAKAHKEFPSNTIGLSYESTLLAGECKAISSNSPIDKLSNNIGHPVEIDVIEGDFVTVWSTVRVASQSGESKGTYVVGQAGKLYELQPTPIAK